MLTTRSSSSDKMDISLSIWPLTFMECLQQSQLQRNAGCQIQTQSVPSPKMRLILIIPKESHTSCWQFAQVKSKPYWVVATLQNSESSRNRNVPTAPVYRQFLNLSNNSGDKRKNEACHTHLTGQAWLLQCWTNGKKGGCLVTHSVLGAALRNSPLNSVLWLPTVMAASPRLTHLPRAAAKAMLRVLTPAGNRTLRGMKHPYNKKNK